MRQLAAYRFRALLPVYDIHLFSLHAKQADSNTIELLVQDAQGRRAMEATATLLIGRPKIRAPFVRAGGGLLR